MITIRPTALSHLNAMFGYNTPIPDAPVTYSHRIGIRDPKFVRVEPPPKPIKVVPPKDPNRLKDSEKRVLMIVKCNNGVTGIDVAKKTKWTQNHCSMILTELYRKHLVRRVKRTGPHIRFYEYFKNDPA